MKKIKNIFAGALCFTTLFTSVIPMNAEEDTENDVTKKETVYAFLNSDGSFKSSTVSEWLHSDTSLNEVHDTSTLENITNLTSDVEPTVNGEAITWVTDASDLYYQGTSSKELPLSMKVTYYFNGKQVDPEDIVGEDGSLEVHIKITNHLEKTKVINGKTRYISTLFPVAIVTDLKDDTFKNVVADDAVIINESKNQVLTFITISGASQILNECDFDELDDVKDQLKDEFVIQADVTDFEMPSILLATTTLQDIDTDDIDSIDFSELTDGIQELKDATAEILDGTTELHDANIELNDKMGEFQTSYAKFQDGIDTAANSQADIVDGAKQLSNGISQMQTLLTTISSQLGGLDLNDLSTLLTDASTTINSLPETVQQLQAMKTQLETAKTQLSNLSTIIYSQYTSDANATAVKNQLNESFSSPVVNQLASSLSSTVDNYDPSFSLDPTTLQTLLTSNISVSYDTSKAEALVNELAQGKIATHDGECDDACVTSLTAEAQAEVTALLGSISVTPNAEAIASGLNSAVSSQITSMKSDMKNTLVGALTSDAVKAVLTDAAYSASTTIVKGVANSTQTTLTSTIEEMGTQIDEAIALCDTMTASVNALINKASQVDFNKVSSLGSMLSQAEPGIQKLITGSNTLYEGTKSMQTGLNTLSSSSKEVTDAINQFKDATQELASATGELNDGVIKFSSEGIDELDSKVNDAINDLDDAIDIVNSVLDESETYTNYAGASEDMNTSLLIIMKTDEVKKAETTSTDDIEVVTTSSSTTLWNRIVTLFKK